MTFELKVKVKILKICLWLANTYILEDVCHFDVVHIWDTNCLCFAHENQVKVLDWCYDLEGKSQVQQHGILCRI